MYTYINNSNISNYIIIIRPLIVVDILISELVRNEISISV